MKIEEGMMPYLGHETYYRIVGEKGEKTPIVLCHGGPGSTHNYLEMLDSLAENGRQVISYDQIGCGNSYLDGHPELWNLETWMNELAELRKWLSLDKVHLLGQSWGGMLLIGYMIERKPEGVRSLTLSSTLPDSQLWSREQHRLIRYMSQEDQLAIKNAEQSGDYTSEEYRAANEHFMLRYCSSPADENSPECLRRAKKVGREAYETAWGPNEFTPVGTLKDFSYTDRLCEINVPTMIFSGTDDMSTPLIAKTMADRIPDARWHLFAGARHCCYVEQNELYCRLLNEFLDVCEAETIDGDGSRLADKLKL